MTPHDWPGAAFLHDSKQANLPSAEAIIMQAYTAPCQVCVALLPAVKSCKVCLLDTLLQVALPNVFESF